jgi:CheY-like chemotaxis protein
VADLKDNINTMIDNLRATIERNQEQDWLKTNLAKFARMLQGQRDLVTVGRMLLSELAPLVGAQQGTVYQMEAVPTPSLWLLASYAQDGDQPERVALGEGLVGQCAVEKQRILLAPVPGHYTRIRSSLGEASPAAIVVLPVLFEGDTQAVIELASLQPLTGAHLAFLEQLTQSIGVVFNTIKATMRTENLLQQSQQLTTELTIRQAELQQTNEELASKARQLAEQNEEVERKNREVEQARKALEEKAAELALTSKYKSEFLANMSHELRTPLNSILILGQQLAENQHGNLSSRQVEWARSIHSAGADLLGVINDILDLSKIESGTVTVEIENLTFASLGESLDRTFRPVAESKHLAFRVELDPDLPRAFSTDSKRLQQILKNLLANAFKFTAHGQVMLAVRRATEGWSADHAVLRLGQPAVAFTVSDTGIGIEAEKQRLIFEAFQQADAGTSRKYGGTGLGLAISRELATLLGGEIRLTSVPHQGSQFTLFLPLAFAGAARLAPPADDARQAPPIWSSPAVIATADEPVPDDRETIQPDDRVLLIVDDDPHYARLLLSLARDRGLKGVVTARGQGALSLVRQYGPAAITLDVLLPDMLGWTVLNHLKLDASTRHIPVQMLSVEEERRHGLARGAFSYLVKPATRAELERALDRLIEYCRPHRRRLLVVEDNERERGAIVDLLAHDDIEITAVGTGGEALQVLEENGPFGCCVVDLRLPDVTGFDLLEYLKAVPRLAEMPVVVYTGKDLTASEQEYLRTAAKSVILKDVQSPERLFDETALFLHRMVANLPEGRKQMLTRLYESSDALDQARVLVVDDDARNIFALTTVLENQGMSVLSATSGRDAIDIVRGTPDLRAVLMDIMMPDMDGYETMRAIRKEPAFRMLPILALTAKAMKGDREKCLEAGASDYIAKPVNTEQLLSLLRVWLHR